MLNGNVLILNQDYQPISVVNVRKSLLLIFLDKAELLHDKPGSWVRTISHEFQMPLVIRLRKYAPVPYMNIVLSRKNILKRDSHRCLYCGSNKDLTIDHVIPKSRGGMDTWENLATACNPCNNKKGNRTPKEAEMDLRIKPFRPNHIFFLRDYTEAIHEAWRPYLYM